MSGGSVNIYPADDMCMDCEGEHRSTPYCNCTYPYREGPGYDCFESGAIDSSLKSVVFLGGIVFILNFGVMIAAKFLKL